ncbi:hypothetical protein K505DRAFT_324630 [Melanomma pulvis-pyrius CBS 109.77]|uniref:Celp0028 effector like protein n=1 Tax=Melanomma pulvis-pyrius CBS 109.77 TaxID=1314802 RepID=A0A6A6XG13_9PLEO|nr:hypothetical protein K505DRAFT_324630 [Melanomma pulvis-pyrius CBS 109.77]
MHFPRLIAFSCSAVSVIAVPFAPIQMGEDDVILYGSGRYQLRKRTDIAELNAFRNNGTIPPKPGYLDDSLFHGPPNTTTNAPALASLQKRKNHVTIIVKNPASRFLGWDIQMSAVVKGAETGGTTIYVTSGYDVSNSVSVGTSATFSLVKDFLEASVSIDYSKSWTSSQAQQFQATVAAGKYGAYVSNAWTNRQSGIVFQGVIGEDAQPGYYQADSFESKSFDGLSWVDGVISLCTGDEFPLKRCLGDGTL